MLRNSTSGYHTLRHARHATILTPRHAMLRHDAPLCNCSRHATSCLTTYVTLCTATPCDEASRRTTPLHLLHANYPNPCYYILPTEWISVICKDVRKKVAILFPFSVYFLVNCVLILCVFVTHKRIQLFHQPTSMHNFLY